MRQAPESKKKAKGTQRKTRIKKTAEPKPATNLGAPQELSPDAQAEWLAIADLLKGEHLISELDRKMLMAYCTELAKYWDYTTQLAAGDILLELTDKKGNVVNYMKNPLCELANKAFDNATKLGAHFGLTPLSRSKIVIQDKPDDDSPEKQAERTYMDILKKKAGKQVAMKAS